MIGKTLRHKTPAFQGIRGVLEAACRLILLGALATAFVSCSSAIVKDSSELHPRSLIWPSPPEPARISYLMSISRPDDIGVNKGFFKKLVEFVLGEETNDIIKPYGIAVDSAGRIIVADTAFKRVHIYDVKNSQYNYIDSTGEAPLESPISTATDAEDNIYVSDSMAGKVFVFNKKGSFITAVDGGKRPTGVAVNKSDKILYVVDTGSHNVRMSDLKGTSISTFGRRGEFNYPVDIFIDRDGDVYVSDTMNFKIQIFDKKGSLLSTFGRHGDGTGDFGRPKGVAVDRDGNIYVADALFDTVQIFDRNGRFLLNFGALGRDAGAFWMPTGLFIDNGDNIYIADSYNMRVQVFEYHGN